MNRQRAAFLVMVDLDPIPGWGHEPESWREHLEADLLTRAGHYNPVVVEFTPADLEPMKHAERQAGADEVRARVEAVVDERCLEQQHTGGNGVCVRCHTLGATLRAALAPTEGGA